MKSTIEDIRTLQRPQLNEAEPEGNGCEGILFSRQVDWGLALVRLCVRDVHV